MLDIDRLRADTPGCASVTHFNNAGAALPPQPVVERQIAHLRREAEIGGYEAQDEVVDERAAVYTAVARLLNAADDEISLHDSASGAWRSVFGGLVAGFRPGDRIVTCVSEYGNNLLAYQQAAQRSGVAIDVAPDDLHGQVDVDALETMVTDHTRLIAISHVPTNSGLVNPAEAVGAVARRRGVPYLLDACQSVGHVPVDVEAIGCDVLSFTGRKYVRGPRGTGALYVRRARLADLEPAFADLVGATILDSDHFRLAEDSSRFETFECSLAAVLGLGVAVRYALDVGIEAIWARIQALAGELRGRLAELPGVTVRDKGAVRGGIVTFTVEGTTPAEIVARLAAQRINVNATHVEATVLDRAAAGPREFVRASVHAYNTSAEIDRLIDALTG